MKHTLLVGIALTLAHLSDAQEIGFVETFGLADDRATALEELVPGTDEYFYYHALHAQNQGRSADFGELIKRWKRVRNGNVVAGARELLNRQALLTYETDPKASLDYVRQELNLQFNHARKTGERTSHDPTQLDPELIRTGAFLERALSRTRNSLDRIEDRGLETVAAIDLNPDQRRSLLSRLRLPDYPNLVDHILADLGHSGSSGFGHHVIHQRLTLTQLDELMRGRPPLRNESAFVAIYLSKLSPPDEVDLATDPPAREAYYDRVWSFVRTLDPVHNSLKANVLYNRLLHDERAGIYDHGRLLTYLQLPRNVPYLRKEFRNRISRGDHLARLDQDFGLISLPPVHDEQPLVRRQLLYHLRGAEDYSAYAEWLRDSFLKRIFAETKIVHGVGDSGQWAPLLTPDEYKQIKERVDIDFSPSNPEVFSADAPVTLTAAVKNVPTLIVNIYEINTSNYLRETGQPLNLAINLDGLVASASRTVEYDEPPERRVARTFAFPELGQRGAYVVELIGNGKSSRALIQKGRLGVLQEVTPAGHAFTVLDEAFNPLPHAHAWLAGRAFSPDPDGRILIPFSAAPRTESIVFHQGDFASLVRFEHLGEAYSLEAGIYVDREALIRRETADIVVRPVLRVNGVPTSLQLLAESRLTVISTDLQGIQTEKEFSELVLREDQELVQSITVPENTISLLVRLEARVENLSANEKQDLSDQQIFALNEMDQGMAVQDLHVTRTAEGHVVELRGKNGEPRPDEPLACHFKHRFFRDEITVSLQTDAQGRAWLGDLDGIERFRVHEPQGAHHTWTPPENGCVYPESLHGHTGETLRIAIPEGNIRTALFDLHRGRIVEDLSDSLAVKNGFLELRDLAAGDYALHLLDPGVEIRVRVTEGASRDGFTLSPRRALERARLAPLQIAKLDASRRTVEIQLTNASPFTRVHLAASRFLPAYDLFAELGAGGERALLQQPWRPTRSFYESGRDIGDEYRYVLDRQRVSTFPGNMLERPGLLLNPWELRDTETEAEVLSAGDAVADLMDAPTESRAMRVRRREQGAADRTGYPSLDFLENPSVVLLNLVPDDDGRIAIPRDRLLGKPHLRILAIDPTAAVLKHRFLEDTPTPTRELRLVDGLDPEQAFSEQKLVTPAVTDQSLELADVSTATFETYDTVAKAYRLLATLGGNPTFNEFSFVSTWPELDEEEQRRLYSKYACHELSFFLYHKDPAFFDKVTRPYLANKKDKTFVDRWLIADDLIDFLEPWRFRRLNAVERVLLAQRLRERKGSIRRDTSHRADLIPPDVEDFNRRFDTAVQTGAMEEQAGVALQIAGALRKRLSEKAESLERTAGANVRLARGAVVAETAMAAPAARPDALMATFDANESSIEEGMASDAFGFAGEAELGLVKMGKQVTLNFYADEQLGRKGLRRFFQKLDQTKEWAENNYYRIPIGQQLAGLVTVSEFWSDYAAHDGTRPFLSTSFALATSSFTEMMMALAVLDLPFKAAAHQEALDGLHYAINAGSPLILFHREIRKAERAETPGSTLVAQHFFRADDRYRHENNERFDKYVAREFLPHVVYGAQVVLTNPTGNRQKLQVLLQIPLGAIPVNSGFYTRGVHVTLEPYSTQTQEYSFYFPSTGHFPHYPVTLSENDVVVGGAEPFVFQVVERLSEVDKTSWPWISQNGSMEDVLEFLRGANLHRIDLGEIAWRMRDRGDFIETLSLLDDRHVYHQVLWSYGILHDYPDAIHAFLRHSPFAGRCGLHLVSPLLTLDPVERHAYQHLEYAPLVNPRAHPIGAKRKILNNRFRQQYQHFMKVLGYQDSLRDADELGVAYYMALQDRIEEAIHWFGRVDRQAISEQLQTDYLEAYLALYQADVERARTLAEAHIDPGVDRWHLRFAALLGQLDEIAGGATQAVDDTARDQAQAALAASEPSLNLQVEAGTVQLDYRNLTSCVLNFYPMDIELLFSRSPFLQEGATQFSFIRPVRSLDLDLPADQDLVTLDLPHDFQSQNVMVEALAGGQRQTQAYYANTLRVQMIEAYGQMVVTHADTRAPVPMTYVKVYARMQDGGVKFFKDGYTDLRGRFDYVSLNTNELDDVQRLAVLILSRDYGATVREAPPPKR